MRLIVSSLLILFLCMPTVVFSESQKTETQDESYKQEEGTTQDKPYGTPYIGTDDATGPSPMDSLYDEGFWLIGPEHKMRIWAWAQEDYRSFSPNYP
jgi:hypothetical protein